jgi:hypothetical protein
VLAGEFVCINPHMVKELIAMGKWDEDFRNVLIANNGSV